MGKTHPKVDYSPLENYKSGRNKDWARDKKSYSHHVVRTRNRTSDDDTFNNFNCKDEKINSLRGRQYIGKLSDIPNSIFRTDTDYLSSNFDYAWTKEDTNLTDTINTALNNNAEMASRDKYTHKYKYAADKLNACKKQIERRGNVGRFYGHR